VSVAVDGAAGDSSLGRVKCTGHGADGHRHTVPVPDWPPGPRTPSGTYLPHSRPPCSLAPAGDNLVGHTPSPLEDEDDGSPADQYHKTPCRHRHVVAVYLEGLAVRHQALGVRDGWHRLEGGLEEL